MVGAIASPGRQDSKTNSGGTPGGGIYGDAEKNIVGASRRQKFYQGNERTRCFIKAFAPSGRRAKCDTTTFRLSALNGSTY